jgi:hypothetical protein
MTVIFEALAHTAGYHNMKVNVLMQNLGFRKGMNSLDNTGV